MSLLRQYPAFRRLWLAGAISQVGDWLSFVAVSVLALSAGGGALGLALVFAAHALPAAVLAPFAGALVDRVDRRRVLVGAELVAAAVTAAMAVAAAAGWLAVVHALLMVRSAISVIVPTAEVAAVRRLVGPGALVRANAILAATWSVAYVAGMALGGAAALLGPALALALDAGTFVVAAAVHATLPAMPVEGAPRTTLATVVRSTPRDTAVALRAAAAHRPLLAALLAKATLAIAGGAGWIALNLVGASAQPFGAAALSFGVLQAVRGAGTGVGPAVAAWLTAHGAREATLHHAARLAMLGSIAALAIARDPVSLLVVSLVWGAGTGTNWVISQAGLQRHATDAVIGRLAAFDELLFTVAMVASAVGGAVIADAAGPGAAALIGAGLGTVTVTAAALWLESPRAWARRSRGARRGVAGRRPAGAPSSRCPRARRCGSGTSSRR